jgi:hypothetical protein
MNDTLQFCLELKKLVEAGETTGRSGATLKITGLST